uniref:Uncharacterized protein TCIL3000_11_16500 n=1 Tax=Trypanosoma congolense (strain IL3000) TaxID=1068625 RepID=G0V3B5_TRYCI|nr:unnamed protein product [Trypanosoma congolense IL3000]
MLSPNECTGQLSAIAPYCVCDTASALQPSLRLQARPVFPPPVSAQQWVDVSMSCLQHSRIPLERLMGMMEDTAGAVMGNDATTSDSSPLQASAEGCVQNPPSHQLRPNSHIDSNSPVMEDDGGPNRNPWSSIGVGTGNASRRCIAARFLLLGSQVGLMGGTNASLRTAVRMAEGALAMFRCPLAATQLALTCCCLACLDQAAGDRDLLEKKARELLHYATRDVMKSAFPSSTDIVLLSKQSWICALVGETQTAMKIVQFLCERSQVDVEAIVLMALLHSATGDYGEALTVARRAEEIHPHSILSGVVFTVLQNAVNEADHFNNKNSGSHLTVLVARMEGISTNASQLAAAATRRVAHFDADAENGLSILGAAWSDFNSYGRLVAGQWALLAHAALLCGCVDVSRIAAEAGLEYVGSAKCEYRQAYCDLLCCAVGVKIEQIERSIDYFRQRSHSVAPCGSTTGSLEVEDARCADDLRALVNSSELLVVQTMLEKVLEVGDNCAEAYLLLGQLNLLEALVSGVTHDVLETQLVNAAHYFQLAIDCNPRLAAAYEGMGRVREEQGAIEMSLDSFTSAAELRHREPVISYEKFLYMLL